MYKLLGEYTLVGNLTDSLGYGATRPMPISMSSSGDTGAATHATAYVFVMVGTTRAIPT
jgi:threonine synthase